MSLQNIYDNQKFFEKYQKMRSMEINANNLLEIPIILSMLPDLKGKKVLDLGCGAGGMSKFFVDNGAVKVLATDISHNMIDTAKNENSSEKIDYQILAMEDLAKVEEKFDLVFSSLAFHYIEDFEKLMKNISRLLKKDGILLFSQEHPFTTAVNNEVGVKQKYVELEGKRYYLISDYNDVSRRERNWNVDGVVKYHRNFSTVVNCITNAGMEMLQLEESQPLKEAVEKEGKYKNQIDRPYFLFVKAKKK